MIVTCADARLLAHAERDERAGDAHHDVEYGDARNSAYLRRLVSGRGEEPPLASTHGLGERRRTFALSRVEQLRSLRRVWLRRVAASFSKEGHKGVNHSQLGGFTGSRDEGSEISSETAMGRRPDAKELFTRDPSSLVHAELADVALPSTSSGAPGHGRGGESPRRRATPLCAKMNVAVPTAMVTGSLLQKRVLRARRAVRWPSVPSSRALVAWRILVV